MSDSPDVKFVCDKCGLCCRNIGRIPLQNRRGLKKSRMDERCGSSGICVHLDEATNLCKIYADRPLECRVHEGYVLFQDMMSYEEYLKRNSEVCAELKREVNKYGTS